MNELSKDVDKFEERGDIPNAVVVSDSNSPAALTRLALTHGQSLADIEKMLELQKEYEEYEAKKAYHKAMAKFKANPPKIWRDMQVKYKDRGGNLQEWSHSDLGVAAEAINKALGDNGLNSTWRTEPKENKETKVTCIITHELGHSEETFLQAGPDQTGSKNAIQAIGSTIFYLQRYTLFALTGLAPARMDDDGNKSGLPVEYINLDMQTEINDLLTDTKSDKKKFFEHFEVESVEKIPMTKYGDVLSTLKEKKEKQSKKPMREPGEEG